MRRIAVGLALALSASLSLAAHAGPQRGQGDENPSGGQAPPPVTAGLAPTWKRLGAPDERPDPRMSSYGVVDPGHDRMVVFGGWADRYFSDTWLLDFASGNWTLLNADSAHPGPRIEHASILDPVRNRMIIFGGKYPWTNEVWALSLSGTPTWTLLATAGTPPSPRETRAIYDPVRDRMVFFGGYSPSFPTYGLDETWELTLSGTPTWHQLATTGGPPRRRAAHSAIYDPVGDRMIVFGGYDGVRYMNDTWSLDLTTLAWQPLLTTGDIPAVRYGHSATFDPERREMVVFGGYNGNYLNNLFVLSLDTGVWTIIYSSTPGPSVRDFFSALYDGARRRIVLFGGNSGVLHGDLWALDTGTRTWSRLGPNATGPAPRLSAYAVTDANSQRLVMFGGWGNAYFDDTWTLALDQDPPQWTSHSLAVHPSARLEHATAYDTQRDRMLLFGGKDAYQFFNDVWQLDLTGDPAWSPVATAGTPPSRRESRAVYDPVRDRLLLFGGFSYPNHLNETWELTLSGTPTWRQLDPTGPLPPARRGQNVIYDPVDDRVLVFGGYNDFAFFYDVWSLSFEGGQEHWTPVEPVGIGPGPRYGATATYDPARRLMIVFGGYDGHYLNDGWALTLDRAPRWTPLETVTQPGRTDFHTMAYDPDRDRFLLFGGNNGQPLGELWELSFANPILVPPVTSLGSGDASVLRVAGATYEPGSRVPTLQLTLPSAASARLELFDVSGRRIADRTFAPAGAGRNALPLAEARTLRAGIYLVRVTQGRQSAVGRAVVVP